MTLFYACISTHHLLDHKPDNLLRTANKHGLVGFYKFGTPGIAFVFGHRESIHDFMDKLKSNMPQKKFQLMLECPYENTHSPALDRLGYHEVTAASLKEELRKMNFEDDVYYTVLGLDKRSADTTSDSVEKSNTIKGVSKKGSGKKKGKS